jgi:hypothetical protein
MPELTNVLSIKLLRSRSKYLIFLWEALRDVFEPVLLVV